MAQFRSGRFLSRGATGMVGNNREMIEEEPGFFTNPWPAMGIALGASFVALGLGKLDLHGTGVIVLLIVATGLVAAGVAVVIQPRSSIVLGLAAVVAFVASMVGNESEWDSGRLVLRVLCAVAAVSAIVVFFSPRVRRAVFSVIILLHFGGILTAVSSPSNSWLAYNVWVYLYKPYLQFMYLNNAYHFYAPEPGPTPLLWFCIEYEPNADGTRNLRWVKVPYLDMDFDRLRPDETPLWPNLEYTRRLSLAESTNYQAEPWINFNDLFALRQAAGEQLGIPFHSDVYPHLQYREPNDGAKINIQSYARHVASTFRHQTKPELEVTGVKVYRAIHNIISAELLNAGVDPRDPALYHPFYMGEFDKNGKMKRYSRPLQTFKVILSSLPELGTIDRDPFLYWIIPIERPPRRRDQDFKTWLKESKITNYVKKHAGDISEEDLP